MRDAWRVELRERASKPTGAREIAKSLQNDNGARFWQCLLVLKTGEAVRGLSEQSSWSWGMNYFGELPEVKETIGLTVGLGVIPSKTLAPGHSFQLSVLDLFNWFSGSSQIYPTSATFGRGSEGSPETNVEAVF